MSELNYYELLGVAEDAPPEEIRKAFLKIARKHHPDVAPGPENAEIITNANIAKDVLLDADKRAAYDKKLHAPEEEPLPPAEPWSPSWGEEASWESDMVDAEVEEEPEPPKPNQPSGSTSYMPPPFDDSSVEGIEKLPEASVPETLAQGPVRVKTHALAAWTAFGLSLFAPLLAWALHSSQASSLFVFTPVVTVVLALAVFIYGRSAKKKTVMNPLMSLVIFVGLFLALSFGVTKLPVSVPLQHLIFQPVFSALVPLILASSFWAYREECRVLKPKLLKKNNSFGELSGALVDEVLEEELNPLWAVPGLRVLRLNHPAFSHAIIFDDRVALVKAVHMTYPGVLKFSGPALINRMGPQHMEQVTTGSYHRSLVSLSQHMPKGAKVYPFISVFPSANLRSFEEDKAVAFVAGDDTAALILKTLTEGKQENVVRHDLLVDLVKAASKSP